MTRNVLKRGKSILIVAKEMSPGVGLDGRVESLHGERREGKLSVIVSTVSRDGGSRAVFKSLNKVR